MQCEAGMNGIENEEIQERLQKFKDALLLLDMTQIVDRVTVVEVKETKSEITDEQESNNANTLKSIKTISYRLKDPKGLEEQLRDVIEEFRILDVPLLDLRKVVTELIDAISWRSKETSTIIAEVRDDLLPIVGNRQPDLDKQEAAAKMFWNGRYYCSFVSSAELGRLLPPDTLSHPFFRRYIRQEDGTKFSDSAIDKAVRENKSDQK